MPYTVPEGLERFFLTVYPEALNALQWYQTTGMKVASNPRLRPSEAERIVRAAEDFNLDVVWQNDTWVVVQRVPTSSRPAPPTAIHPIWGGD